MNQFKFGAFIEDKIVYKGITFIPGFRLDIMNPKNRYRYLDPDRPGGLEFIPISREHGFADATIKYQISPRINVNYPLTDRSMISLCYGQFFQSPMADYLYFFFNTEMLSAIGNIPIGDPNMEAQRTNQYEAAYTNALTDELALRFTAFYKDIYNSLGVVHVQTTPERYYQ
jgi:outer membrane receptor protein involved in Fe transport